MSGAQMAVGGAGRGGGPPVEVGLGGAAGQRPEGASVCSSLFSAFFVSGNSCNIYTCACQALFCGICAQTLF